MRGGPDLRSDHSGSVTTTPLEGDGGRTGIECEKGASDDIDLALDIAGHRYGRPMRSAWLSPKCWL